MLHLESDYAWGEIVPETLIDDHELVRERCLGMHDQYRNGLIDDEYVVPREYHVAALIPGDAILFLPARTAHAFKTTTYPRDANVLEYYAYLMKTPEPSLALA